MTKSEIESHISNLHAHLQAADLSEADCVSLRNEIGHWEDKLALLEFRSENADIDYGYHDQYDFWSKSLNINELERAARRKSLIIRDLWN